MPMALTFLSTEEAEPPVTMRGITKLEGIFGKGGELTAYRIYTGSRPTDHYLHYTVEVGRVLKLTSTMPDYYKPEGSNGS